MLEFIPEPEHPYKRFFKTHFFLNIETIEVVVITLYEL